jgi:hypothetical protein
MFLKNAAGVATGVALGSAVAGGEIREPKRQKPYEISGPTGMRYRHLGRID